MNNNATNKLVKAVLKTLFLLVITCALSFVDIWANFLANAMQLQGNYCLFDAMRENNTLIIFSISLVSILTIEMYLDGFSMYRSRKLENLRKRAQGISTNNLTWKAIFANLTKHFLHKDSLLFFEVIVFFLLPFSIIFTGSIVFITTNLLDPKLINTEMLFYIQSAIFFSAFFQAFVVKFVSTFIED